MGKKLKRLRRRIELLNKAKLGLSLLKKLVAQKIVPKFETPEAFSEYMCRFYLSSAKRDSYFWNCQCGHPTNHHLLTPQGNSCLGSEECSCRNNIATTVMTIEESMPWQGNFATSYHPTFEKYIKIVAPNGILAGRGLYGLPITDISDVLNMFDSWGKSREKSYDSYSMNIAYASAFFAQVRGKGIKLPLLETYLGQKVFYEDSDDRQYFNERYKKKKWRHIPLEERYLEIEKSLSDQAEMLQDLRVAELVAGSIKNSEAKFTDKISYKHAAKILSSLLIVSKIPHSYLKSFGGDSESGILQEAELLVRPCAEQCIEKVFVLCPFNLDAPKATLKERITYCLSYYLEKSRGRAESYILHSQIKCQPPFKMKLVTQPPTTHIWYKIYG